MQSGGLQKMRSSIAPGERVLGIVGHREDCKEPPGICLGLPSSQGSDPTVSRNCKSQLEPPVFYGLSVDWSDRSQIALFPQLVLRRIPLDCPWIAPICTIQVVQLGLVNWGLIGLVLNNFLRGKCVKNCFY